MNEVKFPTYTLEVTIVDNIAENKVGKMAFWNPRIDKIGCDEALKYVKKALEDAGITASVFFKRFEYT